MLSTPSLEIDFSRMLVGKCFRIEPPNKQAIPSSRRIWTYSGIFIEDITSARLDHLEKSDIKTAHRVTEASHCQNLIIRRFQEKRRGR